MNRTQITSMARELMDRHGLYDWKIGFSRAVRVLGACSYRTKTIIISEPLAKINGENSVRDTILHEIAHALAGHQAGHGPAWKAVCRRIGADPSRLSEAEAPPAPWMRVCSHCREGSPAYRRSKKVMACAACCNRYNGGKFSFEYVLKYERTDDYLSAQ